MGEKETKARVLRPLRFYYLMNILDEELEEAWNNRKDAALSSLRKQIMTSSGLSQFFESIHLTDYTEPEIPEGWNEIKIVCTHPKAVEDAERSEIVSLYINILERMTEWMKSSPKVECKLSYFEPIERYTPPEPEKMVPFSMLDPVMEKAQEMIGNELEEFKDTKWFKENYQQKET